MKLISRPSTQLRHSEAAMVSRTPGTTTLLIVDDEQRLRESLVELFTSVGYCVLEASDGQEALERLGQTSRLPDAILMDLKMPRADGMDALRRLAQRPDTKAIPVVIMTAFGGSEHTIQAMKAGAYDYITKPFNADELLQMVDRAVSLGRLSAAVHPAASEAAPSLEAGCDLIGEHPVMRELFKLIGKVSPSNATVLLTGESGTGKDVVAQAIHRHSLRASGPLVSINCAAIPEGLLESELFGHERGAFTGAAAMKQGRFELADGGTLFLDEDRGTSHDTARQVVACPSGQVIRPPGWPDGETSRLPSAGGDEPGPPSTHCG
ncbi:MAG: sigma-54 dependent transcriptional regulator [Nitrospiraceae bacterium]